MSEFFRDPLTEGHSCEALACGQRVLDAWLRSEALRAQRQGTARTYVWTPPDDSRVVAYYSVAPTQVHRKAVSSSLAGGVSVIPAYLLARLALDAALQGAGLGARLLVDALDTIVTAAEAASGRLIVVDAIDEAARAFYQHHDFRSIRGTARLVMKVSTARAALAGPGPSS